MINSDKLFNPKGIFALISKSKTMYKNMGQQDAQELYNCLINMIIDCEENIIKNNKEK